MHDWQSFAYRVHNTVKKTSIGCKTEKYAKWDILALFY